MAVEGISKIKTEHKKLTNPKKKKKKKKIFQSEKHLRDLWDR